MKFSRILSYVKTFFITLLRGGPTPSDPVPVPVPAPDPELSLADLLDAVTDIKQQLLKLSRDLIDEAVIALLERYEGLALSVLRLSREAAKMQGVLSACKEDMTSLVETTERYFSALETFGLHFAKTKTVSLSTRIREDNNLNCLVDWLDNLSTDLQKALNANRDFDVVYQRLQANCLISLHKCTALHDEAVEREAQVKRYGRGWVLLAVVTVVSPILGVLSIAKAAIGGVARCRRARSRCSTLGRAVQALYSSRGSVYGFAPRCRRAERHFARPQSRRHSLPESRCQHDSHGDDDASHV